ncbi:hypothetical protein FOC1_g10006224 [Fusarium oxysporum f. sp. cubense race 1]|uniref:Nephrocystin 3-like N-terminal domain-containing protein n=1 Tax=Fusarium oxysporum f. sp. cubense (strain race 1) TaxID=1229664 RepID=N4UMP3_FUSC1|nr:hypothetical protein FOC1_g10006224 [Fusarium oxysporum f. sp. cubense race 1]
MSGIDRSKLLRRLCPGDQFQGWQQALDLERIPGSCQWLFDDPKLKEWLSKASYGLLWLQGPSATGKTLLSSGLVYHIGTNRGTVGHAAVTCVYFQERHKQYDVADFNHAFASVLRQLVSQLPDTSDTLRKLELAEYDKIPRLWGDELTRLLHRITGELGKVLIILDGVAADVTTKALTYLILAINPDGGSDQIIQVLFTSQAPPPIDFSILHQIVKTQICAYDADVKKFIIKALQSISGKDLSSSHSEFVKSLVRTFDGCFLPVPTWPSEMPMPELLAAIDQITCACKDISIHDKADRIRASRSEIVLCILYHAAMAADAGYSMTMPMAVEALNAWKSYRQEEDGKPFQLVEPAPLGGASITSGILDRYASAAGTEGDISIMKSLVEAGAKVFAKDDDAGDTPLVNTVIHGGPASVKFLLGNGAEISELNEGILKQCRQENPDVAVYLQELGIDVLAANKSEAED